MTPASARRLSSADTRSGLRLFLLQAGFRGAWYGVGMPANAIVSSFAMDIPGMNRENAGLIGAFFSLTSLFAARRLDNTREVHFGQFVTTVPRTGPFKLLPRFWGRRP